MTEQVPRTSADEREELARLASEATPGPWWTGKDEMRVYATGYDCPERVDFVVESPNDTKNPAADIKFIAAACNMATALLSDLAAKDAECQRLRERAEVAEKAVEIAVTDSCVAAGIPRVVGGGISRCMSRARAALGVAPDPQ